MYLHSAVIVDEAKLPEFIHENIDATARRPHLFTTSHLLALCTGLDSTCPDELP